MYLEQSVQLVEHEVKLIKVRLEHVPMVILVHDLYQNGKRLFLRHFLATNTIHHVKTGGTLSVEHVTHNYEEWPWPSKWTKIVLANSEGEQYTSNPDTNWIKESVRTS